MTTTPHVVIVGAGFGGLTAAKELAGTPVRVTLIDRNNYHLFQPLLYQVAIAGLIPAQIAYPLRTIFRRQKNVEINMGEVHQVDFEKKFVRYNGSVLAYDYLILAVGGQTNFFGIDSVRANGFQLKSVENAVATRNHLLGAFEKASREADEQKRRALLTFVIVGGGPTGVETAGALAELIRHIMARDFPALNMNEARVLLVEAGDTVMQAYPAALRKATANLLKRKHVEIMLHAQLSDYNGTHITLAGGTRIAAHTLIWTAGVRAAQLVDSLGVAQAASGRARVERTLQLLKHPEAYVLGDAAHLEDAEGRPLPMLSTVAIQQGKLTAKNILRAIRGQAQKSFEYKDPGLLATIGRNAAVARIWGLSFSGFIAWMIWVGLHIFRLIGFRNRLLVLINWAWEYFFYENQVRLITRE